MSNGGVSLINGGFQKLGGDLSGLYKVCIIDGQGLKAVSHCMELVDYHAWISVLNNYYFVHKEDATMFKLAFELSDEKTIDEKK